MQPCEKIAGGFLVAAGDGPKMFDCIEETLDEVALAVEREVAVPFDLAVRFWRDHRLDGAHLKALDEAVGVIGLVGKERFGFGLSHERVRLCDIVNLPADETERQRIAQSIDNGVDFCREPAARAAYGLVEPPSYGDC